MIEIPATGQCFRRNSNFIKPRQSKENSNSTHPQLSTGLPEIPQEAPVLQSAVPSSHATSTVDAIPTVPPVLQNKDSKPKAPRTPRAPRTSSRSTKGIPHTRLGLPEYLFFVYIVILNIFQFSLTKGDVAIRVRMTLSAKWN